MYLCLQTEIFVLFYYKKGDENMEAINIRFKKIRQALNLSQKELGDRLGLSNSGISSIESGLRNVTNKHLKLLHSEFNVNEDWLQTGKGKMFIEKNNFSLDEYAKQRNLSELEITIVKAYMDLSEELRSELLDNFKKAISEYEKSKEEDNTVELRLVCKGGSSIQKVDKDALRKAAMEDALRNDIDDLDI